MQTRIVNTVIVYVALVYYPFDCQPTLTHPPTDRIFAAHTHNYRVERHKRFTCVTRRQSVGGGGRLQGGGSSVVIW